MKKYLKIGMFCAMPLPIALAIIGAPEWLTFLTGGVLLSLGFLVWAFPVGLAYQPGVHIVINTSPGRLINTAYDSDPYYWMSVNYTVVTTTTNPLLAGASAANAEIQTSTDGGTTWVSGSGIGQSSSVGVAVAIQIAQGATFILSDFIAPGVKYKVATTGSGTNTLTMPTTKQKELTFG